MTHSLSIRTMLTYTFIAVLGLFLLSLVSVNLGGGMPIVIVALLVSILTLIGIALVLFYMFGKSKLAEKSVSKKTSKIFVIIASVALVLSMIFTIVSTQLPPYSALTKRYVFENIGVAFLYIAVACTLLLINNQKFVYWPFWNTKDKVNSDERQKAVRQRVFEKTYRVNIAVLIFAAWLFQFPSQRLQDETIQVTVICILGLPAIIAGWQKDS